MIRYRNGRTGEVVETLDPQPIYDTSPRWVREDAAEEAEPKAPRRRGKQDDGDSAE